MEKSCQYVGRRTWKFARYLLLLSYYAIGISLRPVLAQPPEPTKAPLTYTIVQNGTQPPTTNIAAPSGTIELNAEQQEFDQNSQVITANGKVVVRFNRGVLRADRLRVNLKTKLATAEGNVSLVRGKQILYGAQFDYNFEDDRGTILEARGDIYQPTLVSDLNIVPTTTTPTTTTAAGEKTFTEPLLSDRLRNDQPLAEIENTGGIGTSTDNRGIDDRPTLTPSGTITRLRFQADKVDFFSDERVIAEKIRITNDPFSPPELQVKADRAQFKTVTSVESELTLNNPRVIVENNLDLPFPRDRFVFNQLGKEDNPLNVGFDSTDRGGVYIQNRYYPVFDPRFKLTITPQYFLQRAVTGLKFFDPSVFGVATNLVGNLGQDTNIQASAALSGFDLNNFNNNFRGQVDVRQNLSLLGYPHLLVGQAAYRQQVYNSFLGYLDVQSSFGATLTSNQIPIGNTGVNFDYLVGIQAINANSDRQNLLAPNTSVGLVTLNRYQTAGNLNKSFRIWEGKALSADSKETYNYSPIPVIPYLQINTGIRGGYNGYSNGDNQAFLGYNVGIQGQFGNFSKSSFDYTGFNLNYYQQFPGNSSPFLFDRFVDNRILSAGISQQIIGPLKLGIQSSVNLDSGRQLSTDYYLEYSRRTYNVIVRYNPTLGLGSVGFRLNDFNWDGVTSKF